MATGTIDYREGIDERAIALLADLPQLLAGVTDPREVGMRLAEQLCALFDADYCRFWWITDDPDEVRVLSHFPPIEFKEDWEHIKRLDGDGTTIVKRVFLDGVIHIEPDAPSASGAESRFITVYKALSGAHVPIVIDGRVVGDLALVSKRETHHFSDEQTELLTALAAVTGLAIDRAHRTTSSS